MQKQSITSHLVLVLLLNCVKRNFNGHYLVLVRRQVRLSEYETANIPRTAPIGEVLTLTLGAGRIVEPSVAFPWRTPWSANLFRAIENLRN